MKKIDYSYQTEAANKVLSNAILCADGTFKASVLAVAPGGGKTTISHIIINKYLSIYPNAKALVLTEGQNTLKNQYLSELDNANVPINFTYGDFNSEAQVRVGIPQSIGQLDWQEIDLLIVDEAHNFYLEDMVQKINLKLRPRHKILMTGSPTKYNAYNEKNTLCTYAIHYISAEELDEMGVYNPVDFDVVRTKKDHPITAIKDALLNAKKKEDRLDKIMIACSTIEYAKGVYIYLESIGRKVAFSTSKNDPDSVMIDRFRADEFDTLIVVGKGILGFNDPKITLLIDMRSSSNLDASFQLFARVLRKHPEQLRKAYYRIADNNSRDFNNEVLTCHKMLALMQRDIFVRFTGKNLKLSFGV